MSKMRFEANVLVSTLSVVVLYTFGDGWIGANASGMALVAGFAWLFFVMMWSSFAAVGHADALAERLGEPLGTLILTMAVVVIEVSIIAAVMLNEGPNPTLARDTMFAVLIIMLNGVVGLALLIGGIRHREQSFNLQGARSYLSVVIPLATITLILPRFTVSTSDPTLTVAQGILFSIFSVSLYGTFLAMQTVRHREHFVEPSEIEQIRSGTSRRRMIGASGSGSVAYHALLLVLTLVPLVLLSHKLAIVVDAGTIAIGLPEALGGVLVAVLVLAPEGLAAIEAAGKNHLQRSVNICLGSALATISLTVPAVIVVGMIAGIQVQLGLEMTEMVLLVLTLLLSMLSFGAVRTDMLQGAVHIFIFLAYVVLIFDP